MVLKKKLFRRRCRLATKYLSGPKMFHGKKSLAEINFVNRQIKNGVLGIFII